ncbi:MAG: hypothetical protein A2Y76_05955 [Planctomycetes bacterium RBG_13_60_9]|nr:MAG: hypothetical protein A2Y76_05955 [Planctomycetes bacterium RBG_13_60_9]
MQRVSVRTLVLMMELLIAVVAFQYLVMVRPVQADAIWLAGNTIATMQTPSGEVDGRGTEDAAPASPVSSSS